MLSCAAVRLITSYSAPMRRFPFEVSVVRQTSGGGDHLVKYEGVVEIAGGKGPVRVEMVSVIPPTTTPQAIQEATESVERGVARALCGDAAKVWLHNFIIHPTDFWPKKCEQYTFEAIEAAVRNSE
jgi:hypothetical protein